MVESQHHKSYYNISATAGRSNSVFGFIIQNMCNVSWFTFLSSLETPFLHHNLYTDGVRWSQKLYILAFLAGLGCTGGGAVSLRVFRPIA